MFFYGNQTMLMGVWQREIDITDYANDSIAAYLGQDKYLEGNTDNRLVVIVELEINRDGEWKQTVDEASYKAALQQAKAVLVSAVSDSLKNNIEESYIDTDMTVDELVVEATGMSLTKYLDAYGPKLLPDYAELSESFSVSASYEATRDRICLDFAGEVTDFGYVVTRDILVTDRPEETVIYHKNRSDEDSKGDDISSETKQTDKEAADE